MTNAYVKLDFPIPCTITRRLEVEDGVDEEVGPMYEVIICVYEDELTLVNPQ
jgi:hypothetical protein